MAKEQSQKQNLVKGVLLETFEQAKIEKAKAVHANAIWINQQFLEEKMINFAHSLGLKVYVEKGIFLKESNDCPCDFKLRQQRLAEIENLLNEFEVDGLWLDFIRFPLYWESVRPNEPVKFDFAGAHFCEHCQETFASSGTSDLGKWKSQQITSFVKEVRQIVDQMDKKIILGMFSVPMKVDEYEGAIQKVIGQDFSALAPLIDVFSPMVYHRMVGRSIAWISEQISYLANLTNKPILPIVQARDMPDLDKDYIDQMSDDEFTQTLQEALKQPSQGVIIFTLEKALAQDRSGLLNLDKYVKKYHN